MNILTNLIHQVSTTFQYVQLMDLLDILIVSIFIYLVIILLKRTKSYFVISGLIILFAIYSLSYALQLQLTTTILKYFFTFSAVIIVILFQKEWRSFFEWISILGMFGGRKNAKPKAVDVLIKTIYESIVYLAQHSVGALIIMPGLQRVDHFIEGGVVLNGRVSTPLLLSLFDASSPGHDGGVVIENDLIKRFSTHLPLADKPIAERGTRHRAALGLAERCDAFIIVVSEERGEISIARNGVLQKVSIEEFHQKLEEFYKVEKERSTMETWKMWLLHHTKEKFIAVCVAIILWFLLIFQVGVVNKEFDTAIQFKYLPNDVEVQEIVPNTINITVSGKSSDFNALSPDKIITTIDASKLSEGWNKIAITEDNIQKPQNVSVVKITNKTVWFLLKHKTD